MDLLVKFIGIWMVLVIHIAVGVEGAAFGDTCTGGGAGDCTETNNICDTTCKCSTTSFQPTGTTTCTSKIALDGTCSTTPGSQCADANAACTDSACKCAANFFHNKNDVCAAVVSTLDGACDATDSAAGQCTKADTSCTLDGASGKCQCIASTHYSDTTDCQPKKNPDIACTAVGQCVTNAECDTADSNQCKCNAGYTATPTTTPTMCSGVVKFASLSYMYVVPIIVSMMFLIR